MAVKYASGQIAIVTAGAVGGTDLTDYDTNVTRHITGIFCSITTAGARLRLAEYGRILSEVDCSMFSATAGVVPVDCYVGPGIAIHCDINNTSSGSTTAAQVVVRYEVDQQQGNR